MRAPVVIRRGHSVIHVNDKELAAEIALCGVRSHSGAGILVEDCVARTAKAVLSQLESGAGRRFQGLGQALALLRRLLPPRLAKRIRALHEAAAFIRHLTEQGETALLEELSVACALIATRDGELAAACLQ
jgi:hypothetical protein